METNIRILLLYTLSLKLELVCHLVFDRLEIFILSKLLLLRKKVFHFWIVFPGVEQCDDKQRFSLSVKKTFVYRHTVQYLKVLSKNEKPSFLVKLLK